MIANPKLTAAIARQRSKRERDLERETLAHFIGAAIAVAAVGTALLFEIWWVG